MNQIRDKYAKERTFMGLAGVLKTLTLLRYSNKLSLV